ncbi:MAG: hypothetical protein RIS84_918, partial [Pseudomonadota bacterium]
LHAMRPLMLQNASNAVDEMDEVL